VPLPTQLDLFHAGRREAVIQPTRFDKVIIDTAGSDVNIVLNASAVMGEEVVRYVAQALNALTISNASGENLDRRLIDLYNLARQTSTAAVVELELQRSSTTGLTIPAGSRFGTATGVSFTTLTDVAFPQNVLGPIYVIASCDRTGIVGNVAANTIISVMSNLNDATVTVTNPDVASGGSEGQEDEN
jgi:uncharacterized phage protein gp47/JayE